MPFLDRVGVAPLLLLGISIVEEIEQILVHLGLILFVARNGLLLRLFGYTKKPCLRP